MKSARRWGPASPRALADGDVLPDMLRSGVLYASVPGSGNAYRRSVLERLLPLPQDAHDRHGADLFTIYGSVFFGTVRAIQASLGNYRIHTEQSPDADGLAFGNAELRDDAQSRFRQRLARFLAWIPQRVHIADPLPSRILDFGTQKNFFARGVFASKGPARREHVRTMLPDLFRAVAWQPSYGLFTKLCLFVWMLAIVVLPRKLSLPLARRVCNPASRGRKASPGTEPGASASTGQALAFVYAGYLVRYVSLLILIPFYGRVLGVDAYGEVLAAMSLYAVVFTLVSHGFSTVGARDIACHMDRASVTREFGRHLHARLLLTLGGVAVGVAGVWVSPALRNHPVMGGLAIVFALSHAFNLGWFYQGLSEFKRSIALEVFGFLLSLFLILALVRSADDNWIVLLSLCISNVLANVIAYRQAGRFHRSRRRSLGGRALTHSRGDAGFPGRWCRDPGGGCIQLHPEPVRVRGRGGVLRLRGTCGGDRRCADVAGQSGLVEHRIEPPERRSILGGRVRAHAAGPARHGLVQCGGVTGGGRTGPLRDSDGVGAGVRGEHSPAAVVRVDVSLRGLFPSDQYVCVDPAASGPFGDEGRCRWDHPACRVPGLRGVALASPGCGGGARPR